MPTIRALASSAFGFALLAVGAAENSSGDWKAANVTDADSKLLYAAWGNVNNFGPGITTYGCGNNILGLPTKSAAAAGSKAGASYDFKLQSATDYHFTVEGCDLTGDEQQYFGFCEDMWCQMDTFDVYIISDPKTNALKVTAVTTQGGNQDSG